jgi:hypothetical protein
MTASHLWQGLRRRLSPAHLTPEEAEAIARGVYRPPAPGPGPAMASPAADGDGTPGGVTTRGRRGDAR